MVKSAYGSVAKILKEKPFDFYAAASTLAIALFAFINPNFPELIHTEVSVILWKVIEIYLISASLVVLGSMFCPKEKASFKYYGEMYGWFFIAAASIATMVFLFYQFLFTTYAIFEEPWYFITAFLWGCIGWASFFKAWGMWFDVKRARSELGG